MVATSLSRRTAMHRENPWSHNWLIKKVVNDFIRAALPAMRGVVYDLGCGSRPYATDILAVADRYVGVDWQHTLHGPGADVVADLNQPLPIADGQADVVVSFEVLEHLSEPQTMLSEAHRILRPGGLLFLSVPFQWWIHEAPWDFFRYTRHGLQHLLAKVGFEGIEIEPTTGFWGMWFLKLNYQTRRLASGPLAWRVLARGLLLPLWWIDQRLAPALDRHWPEPGETAGYFVRARRPAA